MTNLSSPARQLDHQARKQLLNQVLANPAMPLPLSLKTVIKKKPQWLLNQFKTTSVYQVNAWKHVLAQLPRQAIYTEIQSQYHQLASYEGSKAKLILKWVRGVAGVPLLKRCQDFWRPEFKGFYETLLFEMIYQDLLRGHISMRLTVETMLYHQPHAAFISFYQDMVDPRVLYEKFANGNSLPPFCQAYRFRALDLLVYFYADHPTEALLKSLILACQALILDCDGPTPEPEVGPVLRDLVLKLYQWGIPELLLRVVKQRILYRFDCEAELFAFARKAGYFQEA